MPSAAVTTAILFPGQGSQTAGMAAITAAQRPDLLAQARAELGADPFVQIAAGTHFAQPALFCAALAHWKQSGGPVGSMIAGHSLGELAALVAGDALDAEQGLRLAVVRGRLMEEAAAARPGGMMAVLGGRDGYIRALAACFELTVANDNAPGQVVLSGAADALSEARRAVRADGLKAIRLPVAGAFHSPLMAGAAEKFRVELGAVAFRPPALPVFSSTAAAPFEDIAAGLAAALTEPVVWQATLKRMRADGAETFLETGPGDVLTGLVRRTLDDVEARSLAEPEAVAAG
ncbi:MAG TPA: ACP S-malonyltransferase [Solirubrobacterales bacterium]|nr:ACP S-malonyltransferase [Solirubrobacterales bacterium]